MHLPSSRAVPRGIGRRTFTVPARVAPAPEPVVPKLAYSMAEAAKVIGVSESTIKRLIKDGQLRSVKLQHRRIIPASAIDDFLSGGSVTNL